MNIHEAVRVVLEDDTDWNLSEDSELDGDDGNEVISEQLDPLDIAQTGEYEGMALCGGTVGAVESVARDELESPGCFGLETVGLHPNSTSSVLNKQPGGGPYLADSSCLHDSPYLPESPCPCLPESPCLSENPCTHNSSSHSILNSLSTASDGMLVMNDSSGTQNSGFSIHKSSTSESNSTPLSSSFSEQVGPTSFLAPTATAVDFFMLYFDQTLLDHIVEQTNLYAKQNPPSDRYKWYDICSNELKAFFGLIIAIGLKKLPAIIDYWSSNPLLGTPELVQGFPINRFKHLLSYLHFNDNTTALPRQNPAHDKLHKIRPVLDVIASKCLQLYQPHQANSINEAMVGFKGRSGIKQYFRQHL